MHDKITLLVIRDFIQEGLIVNKDLKMLFDMHKISSLQMLENLSNISLNMDYI